MSNIGVTGSMFDILRALYENVQCNVKLNGRSTECFKVCTGIKQGCILSTSLFNIFTIDVTRFINQLDSGVKFGNESLSMLLYADDIVLMTDDEHKLQTILKNVECCTDWKLTINFNISKIMQFRPRSWSRTDWHFFVTITG